MRLTRLAVILVLVAAAVGTNGAQAPIAIGDNWTYMTVLSSRTATIKQGGVELATVTFPRGTALAISDGKEPGGSARIYQGTVELRAMLGADIKQEPAAFNFNRARLIFKAQDADVQINGN